MGTNTPNLQLFKPDPDNDTVNVETDLNDNFDILDTAVQEALDGAIETTEIIRVANVGPFTNTEVLIDSITVSVEAGKKYRVIWDGAFFSTVVNDFIRGRIREDNISGTIRQTKQMVIPIINQGFPLRLETRWTATVDENKTFVMTAVRITGTGNCSSNGIDPDLPNSFRVERVNG